MTLLKMNIKDYLSFIAKSLVNFIMMLFAKPIEAIQTPEHLFALGHVVVLFALLVPSG